MTFLAPDIYTAQVVVNDIVTVMVEVVFTIPIPVIAPVKARIDKIILSG